MYICSLTSFVLRSFGCMEFTTNYLVKVLHEQVHVLSSKHSYLEHTYQKIFMFETYIVTTLAG